MYVPVDPSYPASRIRLISKIPAAVCSHGRHRGVDPGAGSGIVPGVELDDLPRMRRRSDSRSPCSGRARDAPLHLGLHRHAQGRHAEPPESPPAHPELHEQPRDPQRRPDLPALLLQLQRLAARHLRRAPERRDALPLRRPEQGRGVPRTLGRGGEDHAPAHGSQPVPEIRERAHRTRVARVAAPSDLPESRCRLRRGRLAGAPRHCSLVIDSPPPRRASSPTTRSAPGRRWRKARFRWDAPPTACRS